MEELRLDISKDSKVIGRPVLPADKLDGDGTALDTVRRRPGYKFKTYAKAKKKLQEAEEWVEFIQKKQGIS